MDEPHRCNVEQKKPYTGRIFDDSTYVEFKNRQNEFIVIEVKVVVILGRYRLEGGMRVLGGSIGKVCVTRKYYM